MDTTSADRFATWLNKAYPGAYRKVNAEDVRDSPSRGITVAMIADNGAPVEFLQFDGWLPRSE